MKNIFHFVLCIAFSLVSSWVFSGENENVPQPQSVATDPAVKIADSDAADGVATIYFTRQKSMMGAIVPHFVVDVADNQNLNAVITQRKTFPPEKSNFDVAMNVMQLYLITNSGKNILLAGRPQEIDTKIKAGTGFQLDKTNSTIAQEVFNYIESLTYFHFNTQVLTPNARLTGVVKNGETIVWNRAPGVVQLEVITLGGDQAFAPAFNVEAGKTYEVSYTYMKAMFEITEKK